MNFDTKINIAPHLFKENTANLQSFEIKPVKEIVDSLLGNIRSSHVDHCTEEEAEAYALYAMVSYCNNPKAIERMWIADCRTPAEAETLQRIIEQLISSSRPARSLSNLLDILDEQLTDDAKDNEDISEGIMEAEAALKGWTRLSNGIYFDIASGNTYGTDRHEEVHIDDIELFDWFMNLKDQDIAILDIYWQTRRATEIPGLMVGIAKAILDIAPAEYPYRWRGDRFEICFNGTWKGASPENWKLPPPFPEQEFTISEDVDEIPLEKIRSKNYEHNLSQAGGEHSDTCFMCGKRTDSDLHLHYLTTGNITSNKEDDTPNSQGCFPVGPECYHKLPARFILLLPSKK